MVHFNLQWLAVPCILYAIFRLIMGISVLFETAKQPDLGKLIGYGIAMQCAVHVVVSLGLAFLIWRAFR